MTSPGWNEDRAALEAVHCWFNVDRVPGRPDVTSFKRRARWHQAQWREARAVPIGTHRVHGEPCSNGSRIAYEDAKVSGANFLSDRIRLAVEDRLARVEKHQTLNTERLWSDLLSSMPMCFNLFGDLHGADEMLRAATDVLAPDHPGTAGRLRFEWSPGRADTMFLGNRTAFDVAVELACPGGSKGIIGVETKYHEHVVKEKRPDPATRLPRYREVAERSEAFPAGWESAVLGTPLQQIWLDHLLVLAMLQHPSKQWSWGRFVLVHPARNPSFAEAAAAYRALLVDDTTFSVRTIEELLDTHTLHRPEVEAAFRERYLW